MRFTELLKVKLVRTKFALLSAASKKLAARKAFELFTTPQSRVIKEASPLFKAADNLQFRFEGNTMQGYRWNHPSEKKVLILHGYESSAVNFEKYVNPLVNKGYEVLAFDAPAHGLSGGRQINAVDYKNFVKQLLERYGPVTSFITHSFGGLAISLVMEEVSHDASWKIVFIAPATESTTAMNQFFSYVKLNHEVRKEFDMQITKANHHPPEWYSVTRAAAQIQAQVLFLQDKNDILTPLSDVEPLIKKAYPNFTFIISEGLGHSKIYRDAATVNAIIRFL